jgi:hypothetical protein
MEGERREGKKWMGMDDIYRFVAYFSPPNPPREATHCKNFFFLLPPSRARPEPG